MRRSKTEIYVNRVQHYANSQRERHASHDLWPEWEEVDQQADAEKKSR